MRRSFPVSAVLAAWGLGWTIGGDLGLLTGLVSTPVVFVAARRLLRARVRAATPSGAGLPLVFDLIASALRAGAPVALAVRCGAAAAPDPTRVELERIAALLLLGATPEETWRPLEDHALLGPLAAVAMRSADSGIRLADGLERRAMTLRAELGTAALVRAQRTAIFALLPLGFCFLPAFVLIGIVPIVAGVAAAMVGTSAP